MPKLPTPFPVYNGGVKLYFGLDTIRRLAYYLRRHKKVLIVTGKKSAKLSGALDDAIRVLEEYNVEYTVFSGVTPNPTVENVNAIIKAYKESGAEAFLAIGGGSVIDATKAARVVVACDGDLVEYLYGRKRCAPNEPPLYVVNLTHGTGSEIDRWAVVTVPETKEKLGIESGYPNAAVDDPKYITTLPKNQTIYVTLDAFAHAVESATSSLRSPYTKLLAREAIKYITEYLPICVRNLDNIEARYWLLYASMIAGIGIDHGATHLGHALEHILSGIRPELPHGAGLGILYKKLLWCFYRIDPETTAYILRPLEPSLKPVPEDAEKALNTYNKFLDEIGFKETLSTYGFGKDDIKTILEMAYENPMFKNWISEAPVKFSREELAKIIKELL